MSSQARTEYKRSGSTQRNLVGPVSADAERATADSLAWPRLLLSTQWPPTDIRLSPCVLLHARMPLALAEFEPSSMLITPSSAVPLLHADIGATSPPPSTTGAASGVPSECSSTAAAESAEASEDEGASSVDVVAAEGAAGLRYPSGRYRCATPIAMSERVHPTALGNTYGN